jgi:hypothetical protein
MRLHAPQHHHRRCRQRRATRALAAVLTAILAGGCAGISDPYQATTHANTTHASAPSATSTRTTSTPADSGDPPGERGGSIPKTVAQQQSRLASSVGATSPQAAIARYTSLWVNWTAQSIPAQQRQLAAISLGQARAQALQAATSLQNDTQLAQNQVSNTGSLLAATPGQGAAAGKWIVVTQESTTGQGDYQGLPRSLHVIYAQLTQTPEGWVISGWSPQN